MIKEYIQYLRKIKGYSDNTATAYEKDLLHFAMWALTNLQDARWSAIKMEDIDRYITEQTEDGLKPATTNRRLAAISGLYRYMIRCGHKVENPCRFESRRKLPVTLPNTIDQQELEMAYANNHGVVKTMLGLLMTTGIRIQELLDLTWEDINWQDCSLRIAGKGGKERVVYTDAEKLETLHTVYVESHPKGIIYKLDQRRARNMIYEALKPYSKAKQLSPHAIRHSFATRCINGGMPTITLAQLMGHGNVQTTQRYCRTENKTLASIYRKAYYNQ